MTPNAAQVTMLLIQLRQDEVRREFRQSRRARRAGRTP
jgi:hypothetical protein